MGRITARKIFLYFAATVSLFYFLVALNYQNQKESEGLVILEDVASNDIILADDTIKMLPEPDPASQLLLQNINNETKPWYMVGGQIRPTAPSNPGPRNVALFPEEAEGDRMIQQINFMPKGLPENQDSADVPLKKVLFWTGAQGWGVKPGRGVFLKEKCPVSTCVISTKRKDSSSADLIIFKDHFIMPSFTRPPKQIWMMFLLESPLNTQQFKRPSVFNWTATYRTDSTVVTPYERWEYYFPNVTSRLQMVNYAANKTKKVAWFVSNCNARNGRLEYARNLSKYIDVDIYGACGTKQCPRTNNDCYQILDTQYKFYLAFENSNCIDYITEKFYITGLKYNVLPIVMGARKEDYLRVAPATSFLHVDDFQDPQELANYLHELDKNDTLYNEYFQWKGTGEMINTKFFCRLCALLHDDKTRPPEASFYSDINLWWRGKGTCINGSWKKYAEAKRLNETKEDN